MIVPTLMVVLCFFQDDWQKEKAEQVEKLQELYENSLRSVGQAQKEADLQVSWSRNLTHQ